MQKENTIDYSIHQGKLKGIISFSCNKYDNKYCIEMSKNKNTICHNCYVDFISKFYGDRFTNKMHKNSLLLMEENFNIPKIPKKNKIIRFNSFGEIHNLNHINNIVKICNHYNDKHFTLWTKRKDIIKKYFSVNKKPDNLILIYSYIKISDKIFFPAIPLYFDKIFIVTDNESYINCKNKCIECMICYSKNNTQYIFEKFKGKTKKKKEVKC